MTKTSQAPQDTVQCQFCEQDRPKHCVATYPHGIFCSNNSLRPTEDPCWKAAMINGTRTLREIEIQNRKSALLAALGAKSDAPVEAPRTTETDTSRPVAPGPVVESPSVSRREAFLAKLGDLR